MSDEAKVSEVDEALATFQKAIEEPNETILEATEEKAKEPTVAEKTTAEAEPTKLSGVEQEAYDRGWRPDGGPKSADEFLRTGSYLDEITARGKEINALKTTIDELSSHMQKQQEYGYNKAVEELETAKISAIQVGDVNEVERIDKEIQTTKDAIPSRKDHPAIKSFFTRHTNWLQDPSYEAQKMREFAEKRDNQLLEYSLNPDEHVRIIEKDLRNEFPHMFENTNKEAPIQVEPQTAITQTTNLTSDVSFRDLNEAQRMLYSHLKRNKSAEKAKEYIKQLVELGEVTVND